MKAEITMKIKSTKCNNCSISINDCKRRLDEKILCEIRNNFPPQLYYWQVPETFEELKELCKELEAKGLNIAIGEFTIAVKIPHFKSYVRFREDGTIFADEDFTAIAEHRTSAQMWCIIRSLVEE